MKEKDDKSLDKLIRQAVDAAKRGERDTAKQLFEQALSKCGVPGAPSWSNTDLVQANSLSSIADAMKSAGFAKWAKDIQNRACWIYRAEEAESKGTYRGF